jgi:hypothetical protein
MLLLAAVGDEWTAVTESRRVGLLLATFVFRSSSPPRG